MKRADFNSFRDEHITAIFGLNDSKGADYAGDEDALGNFKSAAEQLGIEPEQVWAVYAHKHWSAIMSFCKKGQTESEPIEGRLHDVIVYCLLLLGLNEDRRIAEAPERVAAMDEALRTVHTPTLCGCGVKTYDECIRTNCTPGYGPDHR